MDLFLTCGSPRFQAERSAIAKGRGSHAYLLEGPAGIGKCSFALAAACTFLCTGEQKPCFACAACRKVLDGLHPDVHTVKPEKNMLKVDQVRAVISTVYETPYEGGAKIYVIHDFHLANEQAQNALLKTIEEPPEYGIVILMTSNISALLPTIQSRCLTMEFRPLSTAVVESYVKEHCQVPDYQARASAAFAQGNLGKAMRYAKSEDFIERKDHIISLLRHVEQMDLSEMLAVIKDLGTRKDEVRDYIDLMVLWYRDVLLFKATKDINQLLFQDEASYISREASHRSYEKIEEILQAFEKAKVRLRANVNFDITMELMLLTLK